MKNIIVMMALLGVASFADSGIRTDGSTKNQDSTAKSVNTSTSEYQFDIGIELGSALRMDERESSDIDGMNEFLDDLNSGYGFGFDANISKNSGAVGLAYYRFVTSSDAVITQGNYVDDISATESVTFYGLYFKMLTGNIQSKARFSFSTGMGVAAYDLELKQDLKNTYNTQDNLSMNMENDGRAFAILLSPALQIKLTTHFGIDIKAKYIMAELSEYNSKITSNREDLMDDSSRKVEAKLPISYGDVTAGVRYYF